MKTPMTSAILLAAILAFVGLIAINGAQARILPGYNSLTYAWLCCHVSLKFIEVCLTRCFLIKNMLICLHILIKISFVHVLQIALDSK
jgi:hypothetical protein